MTSTRNTLVAQAQAGDRAALETLLAAEQARIYRYTLRMCGHSADAADVLQETLLTVARSIQEFRGEANLSTWLYSIAQSFCSKKRRRPKHAPQQLASLETDAPHEANRLVDDSDTPEDTTAQHELRTALDRAIATLEPMYREVLLLRDVEGLTAPEVGEVLGLSVAAVKTRLHRARAALREALAPTLGFEIAAPKNAACPDIVAHLSRHLEGELDADACAAMERHLETCGHCRDTCDSLKETLAVCRNTTTAVPKAVQDSVRYALSAYLGTVKG
jgi:RNA polymerase sigma-70 factor (ECF subfamily)